MDNKPIVINVQFTIYNVQFRKSPRDLIILLSRKYKKSSKSTFFLQLVNLEDFVLCSRSFPVHLSTLEREANCLLIVHFNKIVN